MSRQFGGSSPPPDFCVLFGCQRKLGGGHNGYSAGRCQGPWGTTSSSPPQPADPAREEGPCPHRSPAHWLAVWLVSQLYPQSHIGGGAEFHPTGHSYRAATSRGQLSAPPSRCREGAASGGQKGLGYCTHTACQLCPGPAPVFPSEQGAGPGTELLPPAPLPTSSRTGPASMPPPEITTPRLCTAKVKRSPHPAQGLS